MSEENLSRLFQKVDIESKQAGLLINGDKTEVTMLDGKNEIQNRQRLNGLLQIVDKFPYLESLVT